MIFCLDSEDRCPVLESDARQETGTGHLFESKKLRHAVEIKKADSSLFIPFVLLAVEMVHKEVKSDPSEEGQNHTLPCAGAKCWVMATRERGNQRTETSPCILFP